MKNERILHADDKEFARRNFKILIEGVGAKHGHELIVQTSSVKGVEKLMRRGLKPTIAVLDCNMPKGSDGEKAASIIRRKSPKTIIISLSNMSHVTFGDYNLIKPLDPTNTEVVDFITNLKH